MKNKYYDLIEQTFFFPQKEFFVQEGNLFFNNVDLMALIEQYGTPLRITYLPKIEEKITLAGKLFAEAMERCNYQSSFNYCYCTKSSHFSFILKEVIRNKSHIEISSAYDVEIILSLYGEKVIDKNIYIICNGFKRPLYLRNIAKLINMGFVNVIPVIDNWKELDELDRLVNVKFQIGLRIATEEEPQYLFYTSRLGLRYDDILPFYLNKIKNNPKLRVKMLHFFINTGIKDTSHYWNELSKSVNKYCELKKICKTLEFLNIGGGFPNKNSLSFEYDYEYMANEIISQIKLICNQQNILEPGIFTEFGSYTVGESGALLFSILEQKQQNDRERWNMIDGSFMTMLPDSWGNNDRFILLSVNNWYDEVERVNLGGLTCDSMDYYNDEAHLNAIFLPKYMPQKPLYIGFFHTGAYQDALSGYGGIQHCLIPAPKHVIVYNDAGVLKTKLFAQEQEHKNMLKLLGY